MSWSFLTDYCREEFIKFRVILRQKVPKICEFSGFVRSFWMFVTVVTLRPCSIIISTSLRDISDYICSHLLPRNRVKSDLTGIN